MIIFVRHGQSKSNITNTLSSDIDGYPLTEEGIRQTEAFSETIPETAKIDSFYTSPVLRAVQTAEIISKRLGIKPVIDNRLWEWRMGNLNDLTFPSQAAIDDAITKEVESGFKGGMEKWKDMQDRMKSFAYSVDGVTLAVTHQGPLMSLLGTIDRRYDHFSPAVKIANASATTIDFKNMKLLSIGSPTFPRL
jgi:probable phosphoglycerate mutase